jgi:hypothetical protein
MRMEVKVDSRNALAVFGGKYQRLMSAEATRVVKRSRKRIRREIFRYGKKTRRLSALFFRKGNKGTPADRYVHANPESDFISPAQIVHGFTRTIEISNAPLNLWTSPKNISASVKTKTGRKWMIYSQIHSKLRKQPGVFWLSWASGKLKWSSILTEGQKGLAFIRRDYPSAHIPPAKAESNDTLAVMKGPSFASVMRKSGAGARIISQGEKRFGEDYAKALNRMHEKLNAGVL